MLTPEGVSANKIDKVMLLAMWTNYIQIKRAKDSTTDKPEIIAAGMGKPTLPINTHTLQFLSNFWSNHSGNAIGYGHPQGDLEARETMAEAMSKWYGTDIAACNILFSVGGAGSLKSIFLALKSQNINTPNFRVITPFPYYSLYADNDLKLHPIDVMQNPGYRLTAESLHTSILSACELAKIDQGYPRVLLLCDPNNPLGTVLGKEELQKIACILRDHSELYIVLDEAYAEMVLSGEKHVSLLSIAPDLKDRIIIMRSATKGLSAAGERMAVTMAFNNKIMTTILQNSINNYGHAPRSLQMAYAVAMNKLSDSDIKKAADFYRPKVEYVSNRLALMGASMPDAHYHAEGTFYVMADFSDLIGLPLPNTTYCALNKRGKVLSDEDITYYLLFEESVMIAPLSYLGVSKSKGYMRITSSGDIKELEELMNRLETRLKKARKEKQKIIQSQLAQTLPVLQLHQPKPDDLIARIETKIDSDTATCLKLKQQNMEMKGMLLTAQLIINQASEDGKSKSATIIQSYVRGYLARKKISSSAKKLNEEWYKFTSNIAYPSGKISSFLKNLTTAERLEFMPWRIHLEKSKEKSISSGFLFEIMNSSTLKIVGGSLLLASIAALIIATWGLASSPIAISCSIATAGIAASIINYGFFSKYTLNVSHHTIDDIAGDDKQLVTNSGLMQCAPK